MSHHHQMHHHGVMKGLVVRPYDLLAGLLLRGTHADLAGWVSGRVPPGGTVLDVGTGPGRWPVRLARLRPDLTLIGVDPSADMLARARSHAVGVDGVRFLQTGAEALPAGTGTVDAVVSSLSSHHWEDRDAALTEQARVLRPGGVLALLDLRSKVADELTGAIAGTGLVLTEEASPLRRARRRFAFVTAVKPTT